MTKKLGGAPVYVWALVGILGVYLYRRHVANATPVIVDAQPTTSTQAGSFDNPQSQGPVWYPPGGVIGDGGSGSPVSNTGGNTPVDPIPNHPSSDKQIVQKDPIHPSSIPGVMSK